ncbi:MAG: uroporphyrinogen decarboxylase family protein [Chloroflexota bacterium]|nr:uroporphyrinogen decarboxylase family protein [Chloroflexota bacterium]
MNGYERIVAAIQRKQPDRIPIMEWSIHPNVINGICPGGSMYDLVEALDLDGIGVGGRHVPKHWETKEKVYVNPWGIKYGRTAEAYAPIEGPIVTEADADRYVAPDPWDEAMVADVRVAAKRFKGKKFIAYLTRSDFMFAADLHGITNLLTDFVDNPRLAHKVTQIVSDYYCELVRAAIKAGADGVVLADDWAFNTAPMMSPKHFQQFVLPYFKRAVDIVHDAGGYAIKHSDGNIWPILEMTVNTGVDAINPIQPDAGMDIGEVKQKYGQRVCLIGNINCGYTLSEAPIEQVVRETKEAIRKAGPGGGFVMMSSNSLHSSVNPKNYRAMVETTKRYGVYPLDARALAA